ncbi:MAG: phosphate regulon transcriptional regulator PhoB [Pseudomonadota bacterium]
MAQNILIVEDERAIREMVAFTLSGDGYDYLEARDADEARKALNNEIPDLILLDWMLPGLSGIDFARRLKRDPRTAGIPIIMLTAKSDEAEKVKGLDYGADDFVTKPFSTRELLARIRAVIRRTQAGDDGELIEVAKIHMNTRAHRVIIDKNAVELSPTEFRLLGFFLTHLDRVYSRSQILDAVWGNHAYIEERTVDVHIRRLRKLLAEHGCDKYVQTVRGVGYRFSLKTAES